VRNVKKKTNLPHNSAIRSTRLSGPLLKGSAGIWLCRNAGSIFDLFHAGVLPFDPGN
jgi:hypothetical protein